MMCNTDAIIEIQRAATVIYVYILRRGLVLPHEHMLLQCPLYEPGFLAETPINYTIKTKILFSTLCVFSKYSGTEAQ